MPVANEPLYVVVIAYWATIFMLPAALGGFTFSIGTKIFDFVETWTFALPYTVSYYLTSVAISYPNFLMLYIISSILGMM